MVKFMMTKTGEIKSAYSLRTAADYAFVKFKENGKEYKYLKKNIRVFESELPFVLYSLELECYKCHETTEVLTYITYSDRPGVSLRYPWKTEHLLAYQNVLKHMKDPSIEYYGLNVIGSVDEYDSLLLEKFPRRIKLKYSSVQKREYPMNICTCCGARQGEYYIYRAVNERIKNMQRINVVQIENSDSEE